MAETSASHAGGGAAPSAVAAARALAAAVRARADDIERDRRLPTELVDEIADAGLFRLCVPRALGGLEADPATMVAAIEEIAKADGSSGWCVMIGATSGLLSAYLPTDVAREVYASPRTVTGGVFAPYGTATVVDGGYRVSGRWPYASGCEHCGWLMGGSVVVADGTPRLLPGGQPDSRLMLFPATDAEIVDTWTVSGLRGTGSHDIAVRDLRVPAGRSASLITDRPHAPGPLYAFPVFGLLALGIAGVALGIARSAVEELVRIAAVKTPTGGRKRVAERAAVQTQVAEAEALLRSARAFLFDAVADAWHAAEGARVIALAQRAALRLAATHAVASAARVVDLMYNAGGGTSVYATSPLQRQFRDVHVITQHMMVAPPMYELTGRLLLGVDADTSML